MFLEESCEHFQFSGGRFAAGGHDCVTRGQSLDLNVVTDPPSGDGARFAWYSSAGAIERYQSNPATMVASDTAATGWLFVVVRDGKGGIAWRGVEVTVQ